MRPAAVRYVRPATTWRLRQRRYTKVMVPSSSPGRSRCGTSMRAWYGGARRVASGAVSDSFYRPLGDGRWASSVHTTGPWDPGAQHGGPPSALLGRAVERCAPRDDMVVARFTVEILGAVPVAELDLAAEVVRPGRSVELVSAVLRTGGRDVAR